MMQPVFVALSMVLNAVLTVCGAVHGAEHRSVYVRLAVNGTEHGVVYTCGAVHGVVHVWCFPW